MIQEVSVRYARALFELGQANGKSNLYLSELRVLADAFGSNEGLRAFFESPVDARAAKAKALEVLSGKISQDVYQTLLLLVEKDRCNLVVDIGTAFEQLLDESQGLTRGTVTSASVLSDSQKTEIEATIQKFTGKKVLLKYSIDAAIVGGLTAQVGGWTFDDSLTAHLTRMKEKLSH